MWSRPEIVVMITLGREKLMQHMLLRVHEATEQCVVVASLFHQVMSVEEIHIKIYVRTINKYGSRIKQHAIDLGC